MKFLLIFCIVFFNSIKISSQQGFCLKLPYLVEEGRTCRKPCQSNQDCRGPLKRCFCDGVCGQSCFNPLATCPELSDLKNGTFEYSTNRLIWKTTVHYQCDNGYALRGDSQRICQSDRKWSGKEPFCSDLAVCGQSLNPNGVKEQLSILTRVVGGIDALEGAWPWQVVVLYQDVDVFATFAGGLFGGGSLINNYWVLTAAHVIEALERRPNILDMTLLGLGYTTLPSPSNRASSSGKLFRPRFYVKHPQYAKTGLYDYDIALVRVGREVVIDGEEFRNLAETPGDGVIYSDYIRPICLPCTGTCVKPEDIRGPNGEQLLTGNETPAEACEIESAWLTGRANANDQVQSVVTGFGSTRQVDFPPSFSNPAFPGRLQQGVLKIDTDDECLEAITKVYEFFSGRSSRLPPITYTKQMICARSENDGENDNDIDACQGDSGGPLVREIQDENGDTKCYVQLGVVSFGFGCAWKTRDYAYPGFYSDVSSVIYWLNGCKDLLTDAAGGDNLTCGVDTMCRVLAISPGIDASTASFPLVIEGFELPTHTLLTFSCFDSDAFVVGPNVVTCLSNGSWSGPYPTRCERRCIFPRLSSTIDVDATSSVVPGLNAEYAIGDELNFRCNDPTSILVGNSYLRCTENGDWSGRFPLNCTERLTYCYGTGDPHYTSFDGKRFDFQGTCSYVLVNSTSQSIRRPGFSVEVDNENRGGNTRVSWLRKAYVTIGSTKIELNKGRIVSINGALVNLPYYSPNNAFNIMFSGFYVLIQTFFGMTVTYDGNSYIAVGLPRSLAENVQGLCGNFNGDPNDDFLLLNSSMITDDVVLFGNQYQTDTKIDCIAYAPDDNAEICSEENEAFYRGACSVITNIGGCFSNCTMVDPTSYFNDCVFDACAYDDSGIGLSNNLPAFVKACQDFNVAICSTWRADAGIPVQCPAHSYYSTCASRCPETCTSGDTSICDQSCVEGCVCDDGFVLSGDECVPSSECGCEHHGLYYKSGESFYEHDDCIVLCYCKSGQVSCKRKTCGKQKFCGKDNNGRTACVAASEATCSIYGNLQYQTFDGDVDFDLNGNCTRTLTETVKIKSDGARWFSVAATSEFRSETNEITELKYISITFRRNLTVKLGNNGIIFLNGSQIQGFKDSFMIIEPFGFGARLKTQYGLEVFFDRSTVRINLESNYFEKVEGFCGNYNGIVDDDQITGKENDSVLSIQDGQCNSTLPLFSVCSPNEIGIWSSRPLCGTLTGSRRAFGSCQKTVNSQPFFEKCVNDLCVTDGNTSLLNQVFNAYAGVCLQEGIQLCNWREEYGSDNPTCPRNSHYEGCSRPCQRTCQTQFASSSCEVSGYVEGCVCNVGYLRDGNRCVRPSDCGVVVDGIYTSKDLCLENNGGCSQNCINDEFNGVECSCDEGFVLAENGFVCRNELVIQRLDDAVNQLGRSNPNMSEIITDLSQVSFAERNIVGNESLTRMNISVYKNSIKMISNPSLAQAHRFTDYWFTSRGEQPFMALLAVENPSAELVNFTIQASDNYTLDSSAHRIVSNGSISKKNFTADYHVFQKIGRNSLTICEIYFVLYSTEIWQSAIPESFKMSYSNSNMGISASITGALQNVLMGYTVLSRGTGIAISEAEIAIFMGLLIEITLPGSPVNCSIDNGGCEDRCVQFDRGSICKCTQAGYVLAEDLTSCTELQVWALLQQASLIEREISGLIPNFYQYRFDGTDKYINDGGNDMFDRGNIVNIYEGSAPIFSETFSYGSFQQFSTFDTALSSTSSYPFMAFAWISNPSRQEKNYTIRVNGNLGADGRGQIETYRGSINSSTGQILYRVFQVYGAFDPSVCEVYFAISKEEWSSQAPSAMIDRFSNNTDLVSNEVKIVGTPQNVLFGYVLLSRSQGQLISLSNVRNFLQQLSAYASSGIDTSTLFPPPTIAETIQSILSRLPSFVNAVRNITTTTPQWYSYNYDFTGSPVTEIRDGGNDMYDGGNRITVSTNNYRFNATYNQFYSANNGQEFFVTYAGHPFVALYYGSPQRTSIYQQIEVSGNAGADGFGFITKEFDRRVGVSLDVSTNNAIDSVYEARNLFNEYLYRDDDISGSASGSGSGSIVDGINGVVFVRMRYSYFQISGARDPTICEVYFTINSDTWLSSSSSVILSTFGNSTEELNNTYRVFNDNELASVMGYTLLSRNNGIPYNESEINEIMTILLRGLEPENTNLIELLRRNSNSSIQISTNPRPFLNFTQPATPFSIRPSPLVPISFQNFAQVASVLLNEITEIIPSWYSYNYDSSSSPPTEIRDGGSDMYDGGNRISIYTDEVSLINSEYNRSYAYDDFYLINYAGHPFITLLLITNPFRRINSYEIRVTGNAGADNQGNITISMNNTINIRHQFVQFTLTYSYFQISGTSDPSICEVYFYAPIEPASSFLPNDVKFRFGNSTDNLNNSFTIEGGPRNVVMGYLLLSRANGLPIEPSTIRRVIEIASGSISPGSNIPTLTTPVASATNMSVIVDSTLGTNLAFALSMANIRRTTPSWYSYVYDDRIPPVTHINDGGNDMYDNGNRIYVRRNNELLISEATYNRTYIYPDFSFSTYAGHPFVAILNISGNRFTRTEYQLQVLGDPGADGSGRYNTFRGNISNIIQNKRLEYFVSQISGANDPSICQVFFVISSISPGESPEFTMPFFSDGTRNINISLTIGGTPSQVILGYILLSKVGGVSFSADEIRQIMRKVSDGFGTVQIINSTLAGSRAFLSSMENIRRTTPSWYSYVYDDRSPPVTQINDGGNDMYDNGNRIFVRRNNEILISEAIYNRTYIYPDFSFSTYAGHPFVAVMYIQGNELVPTDYQLQVLGNAGADGSGNYNTFRGSVSSGTSNLHMQFFVSQISGTSDPSICQVFFVTSSRSSGRAPTFTRPSFSNGTNNINISLTIGRNISQVALGYILLSKVRGVAFSEVETQQIMQTVLSGFGGEQPEITTTAPTTTPEITRATRPQIRPTVTSPLDQSQRLVNALREMTLVSPEWYYYIYDDFRTPMTRIRDGRSDMYDSGNIISVLTENNDLNPVAYNQSYSNSEFNFVTMAGYPFIALLWVNNSLSTSEYFQIQVRGNAGADGRGNITTSRNNVLNGIGGFTLTYSYFQISEAFDPSICEVYFWMESNIWSSNIDQLGRTYFGSETNILNSTFRISGRPSNILMGYTLLSKRNGLAFTFSEINTMMLDLYSALAQNDGSVVPIIFTFTQALTTTISRPTSPTRSTRPTRPTRPFFIPTLTSILDQNRPLVRALQEMTSVSSEWFYYRYDQRGSPMTRIQDGGSDMYDGGNIISINSENGGLPGNVQYNRSYRNPDFNFTTLAGYPFLALLWIDNSLRTSEYFQIQVHGNPGSDGSGNITTFLNNLIIGAGTYRMMYSYFQISGAGDPSICEVYFWMEAEEWSSNLSQQGRTRFVNNTRFLNNSLTISGYPSNILMGYTLLSKRAGLPFEFLEVHQAMFDLFTALGPNRGHPLETIFAFAESFTATNHAPQASQALSFIQNRSINEVRRVFPITWYNYSYDSFSQPANSINDGGNDMYDTGNQITIYPGTSRPRSASFFNYASTFRFPLFEVATGGSRVRNSRLQYPFFTVASAFANSFRTREFTIEVSSNYGADGRGRIGKGNGTISFSRFNAQLRYHTFQVYNANDPSICEVYFVLETRNLNQRGFSFNVTQFSSTTREAVNRVTLTLPANNRPVTFGYCLLSQISGREITQAQIRNFLTETFSIGALLLN